MLKARMRMLLLNHNVVGTGTFQRAINFGRELARSGHDVTVVTTSRSERRRGVERRQGGVRVIEAPDLLSGGGRNGWDPWNTFWRMWRLRPDAFDLVHAFDCRPAVLGPALMQWRAGSVPLFLDWADWWGRGGTIMERSSWPVRTFFGPFETWLEEAFRPLATGNTTISDALRERCIGLGVPADRVVALPNGCIAPAAERPSAATARGQLGLDARPVIVHLGVMQRADAEFLFAAFRLLRARVRDALLVLVGHFRGAVPSDLAPAVQRTGYVDEGTRTLWLAAADVAVVPLRDTVASRGRWPGKVNEYLTAGVPIAMPAVGAAAAAVCGAGAGRVCSATAEALAGAIEEVVRDAEGRHAMRRNAWTLAAGELAWSAVARRLLDFYDRCGSLRMEAA